MSKGRKKIIKYLVFIILLAAAIIGLQIFFSSREVVTYTSTLKNVIVTRAGRDTVEESVTLSSYIESQTMVPIVPFVSGTIENYYIEAGDKVEKDQILATIDQEPYRLQVAQAEAAVAAYESSYTRVSRLAEVGAATSQELDTLTSQLDAARAQLELANLQLSYTEVKSSVDGTVIISNQGVGDIANSQSPLAVIADTDNLVVNVSIPERYYTSITNSRDSLDITVYSDTNGASTTASLISIAPYINPTSKTFTAKIALDDASAFTIGMYVKVRIGYERYENVMTLPVSVMKADGSLYYVDGSTARYIAPGNFVTDGTLFIVPSGYEDELFVIQGQNNILDGEEVNILGEI